MLSLCVSYNLYGLNQRSFLYHIFPAFGSILDHPQVLGDLRVQGSGRDLALNLQTVDCLRVGRVGALRELGLLRPVLAVQSSAQHVPENITSKELELEGGSVAEWSKALKLREKINENQNIPGSPPGMDNLKKRIGTEHWAHRARPI